MSENDINNNLVKKDLKIQALLEKLSAMESQVADLRVDLTISEIEKNHLAEKVEELAAQKTDDKGTTKK